MLYPSNYTLTDTYYIYIWTHIYNQYKLLLYYITNVSLTHYYN